MRNSIPSKLISIINNSFVVNFIINKLISPRKSFLNSTYIIFVNINIGLKLFFLDKNNEFLMHILHKLKTFGAYFINFRFATLA